MIERDRERERYKEICIKRWKDRGKDGGKLARAIKREKGWETIVIGLPILLINIGENK